MLKAVAQGGAAGAALEADTSHTHAAFLRTGFCRGKRASGARGSALARAQCTGQGILSIYIIMRKNFPVCAERDYAHMGLKRIGKRCYNYEPYLWRKAWHQMSTAVRRGSAGWN